MDESKGKYNRFFSSHQSFKSYFMVKAKYVTPCDIFLIKSRGNTQVTCI